MTDTENPSANVSTKEELGRRHAVPILHTRGTHYDVGFDIGRTFSGLIRSYMKSYRPLNETYLPLYETEAGKQIYEETLACAEAQYPGYVREIRGTADGANVPFHELFLMHLDDIVPNVATGIGGNSLPVGCSTVICNYPNQELLGHNEDALAETLNHWYLVSARVVEPEQPEENFVSLSYAGFLPGYTMGYNCHGLVYSINTLSAATLRSGKTPRYFLARALLAAESFEQVLQILGNEGCGAAEGFSVNLTFLTEVGERLFWNIEVGPCDANVSQSRLNVLTVRPGKTTYHCNKYLRLEIPEVEGLIIDSSVHRMEAICKHATARSRQDIIDILSDQSGDQYRVYQEFGKDDYVKTIATGIFDCIERTWTVYTDKPNSSEPILVIPLLLQDDSSTSCNKVSARSTTNE